MELKDFIKPELVNLNLRSTDKKSVINELIKLLKDNSYITDEEAIFQKVMKREELSTTGVGNGIAIPHVKSSDVKEAAIVIGKSEPGIDFNSLDNKPCYLFFLIAAPEKSEDQHLKLLAKLSRMLVHQDFREQLMNASNPDEIREVINRD